MDVNIAAANTRTRLANFTNLTFKFTIIEETGSLSWERPNSPFVKFNCDDSWMSSSNMMGFGCVASVGLAIF